MKFFIDTANIQEIKDGLALGMVDGVTTNPSLVAREKKDFDQIIKEILSVVDGPVSLEVMSLDAKGMLKEGRKLAKLGSQVVIKVPMTTEGLKATRIFASEGIRVDQTADFFTRTGIDGGQGGSGDGQPLRRQAR